MECDLPLSDLFPTLDLLLILECASCIRLSYANGSLSGDSSQLELSDEADRFELFSESVLNLLSRASLESSCKTKLSSFGRLLNEDMLVIWCFLSIYIKKHKLVSIKISFSCAIWGLKVRLSYNLVLLPFNIIFLQLITTT